ncbi:hypothetical protein Tco_0875545 [Tanacetum coccineum]|uniref:Uncharacterized protein n=1 Tax=Tanacetum coccineum TaxID=301880 RepID=A0ABQ5BVE5_9ASTR
MAALKYKDDHNKIAYLGRERGCEDFTDILGYLDHSPLRYALTHAPPVVFDSLVKQFWATAVVRPNAAGSHDLVATIDDREVVVTESLIRTQLHFDDANGIFDMPIPDILEGMRVIGYPTDGTLTFLKSTILSPHGDFDDAAGDRMMLLMTAVGSAAEAHLAPHSPGFTVRDTTRRQQPVSQDPILSFTYLPKTGMGYPYPSFISNLPAAQTFNFEEPLVFGPEPRPAGYVDPDVIAPLLFGPQPRPLGYVDPDFEEPIIFGPHPRPDTYLEPEDLDNVISMEDDTTHGGFHEESPVRPDDAPTPTADAAGRAEDPALLTALSAKIDRCMGRIDSLETELGTSKKDDIDLDGLSRMASTALGHDQPAGPSEDVEDREEEEVPLRRKRSAYRRARTEFSTPAFEQFQANLSAGPSVPADKGKAPMPDLDIPAEFLAEDAQARKRFEEEQASERLVQRLQAEDLAQEVLPNVSEERAKELDDLMMRMTETDWLNLMMQVGSNPALAKELLGADTCVPAAQLYAVDPDSAVVEL